MGTLVGIDVGGTFTDLFLSDPVTVIKVPSTGDDPSAGVVDALQAAGIDPDDLTALVHGTTIATNAVIERRGARCALVTTLGFRDVLELGRRDRPSMYGLTGTHRPLIERDQRWEVTERVDYRGQVLVALDDDEVRRLATALAAQDIEAVVISFLHSYANPEHEQRAAAIFREVGPGWHVVTSSSVLREYYEFERTSTAVIQGYLQPLVSRYADRLVSRLADWGYGGEVLIMQSNGGVTSAGRMGERAAHVIRSGPAAGVIAAARLAEEAGFRHVITADMGGTSFDVAVVTDAEPRVAETTLLDFRIPLRLAMIDVHTIGAGGGSIAFVDRGGVLQVGPRSAGSVPGPVCYGRGGTDPTVTDANLVLGRIDADRPIGGVVSRLDRDAARAALTALGHDLGLGPEETAAAVIDVVNQRMAGRMRLISVEQGHDPRAFALVAFGGAGPLHGAALLRDVGVGTMLVPPHPGVLCAMGCALADVRHDVSRTVNTRLDRLDGAVVQAELARQRDTGLDELAADGAVYDHTDVTHVADMSYLGQIHSLRVPVEPDWDPAQLTKAFSAAYEREYGNTLDLPVLLVNLKTAVSGVRTRVMTVSAPAASTTTTPLGRRQVWFGGWHDTPIYDRAALSSGSVITGPAVIEQADTTTVIEPGMTATVDDTSNLVVTA